MPKMKTLYGTNEYNPVIGFSLEIIEINLEEFPSYIEYGDGSVGGIGFHHTGEWFSTFSAAKKYYMDKMQRDLNNLRYQIKNLRATKKDDVPY